ncbi:hypothetical protein HQ563_05725 [bacterium]|nr:hypothetical protein [bacterium]
MTPGLTVDIVVEGDLDEAVLTELLRSIGIGVLRRFGKRGKDDLRKKVRRYNHAARHSKWVVLVDLNNDAECPPPFVASWLPDRNPNLQFRVAVRAIESWLLADTNAMARFLRVPVEKIPLQPEKEPKPKQTLINVARRSRSKRIRQDLVPPPGRTARQGPGYISRLIEFTVVHWDPQRASKHAPSLERALNSLSQWKTGNDA